MINSVISKKAEVDKFLNEVIIEEKARQVREKLKSTKMDSGEWAALEEVQRVLAPFQEFIDLLQGPKPLFH